MVVAGLRCDLVRDQPARRLEVEHHDLRFQQRGVDPLPLAGSLALVERDHDPLRHLQARCQVRDRRADAHRPLSRLARHGHQAAHALRDLIDAGTRDIRPVLAEARDRAIDDARVHGLHGLIIDAEAMLHVRPVVLDHDVGGLDELEEDRPTLVRLQIQRDAALVALDVLEIGPVAGAAGGLRGVRVLRCLDLDHVRAPVAKLADRGRAGAHARQVEHDQIVEGQASAFGHGSLLSSRHPTANRAGSPAMIAAPTPRRVARVARVAPSCGRCDDAPASTEAS